MKLEKIIKALPIFTSAAIRAATVNTNWLIASELMSAVEDRQAMLNLLRDLNEDADTLDQVTDKQIIKRLRIHPGLELLPIFMYERVLVGGW